MTHPRNNYRKWWEGKFCRLTHSDRPFKRVIKAEFIGPPSGVYGIGILHYEDGTSDNISHGNAFKPRKKDVEVRPSGGNEDSLKGEAP